LGGQGVPPPGGEERMARGWVRGARNPDRDLKFLGFQGKGGSLRMRGSAQSHHPGGVTAKILGQRGIIARARKRTIPPPRRGNRKDLGAKGDQSRPLLKFKAPG
jgi:hypothetical protein